MVIITMYSGKGGIGKTMGTVNVGLELSKMGLKVLVVDNDPQANGSQYLDVTDVNKDIFDIYRGTEPREVIVHTKYGIDLIPNHSSHNEYSVFEDTQTKDNNKYPRFILKSLKQLTEYDYILIDCPPRVAHESSLALAITDYVVAPFNGHMFSVYGIKSVIDSINHVKESINKDICFLGAYNSCFDKYSSQELETQNIIKSQLGELCFDTKIPFSRRIRNWQSPISVTKFKEVEYFKNLANEILGNIERMAL